MGDIKDNGNEGGRAMVLGEAEENDGFNLMTMPDLLTPGDVNKENVSSSNSNTSSHKFIEADLSNEDDKLLSSKTIQTKALAILWAEAIKAQNEGHYKEAIRNFTAIYENKHSTPEMKHKTKCRLVFALYQDNQADEAEKIGWDSDAGSTSASQLSTTTLQTTKETFNTDNTSSNDTDASLSVIDVTTIEDATKDKGNKNETPKPTPDIIDLVKDLTPSSTPGEDESIITRASECSDDSNLIKLDLSQLVGEPNNASEDAADNKLKDNEEGDMKNKRSSRSTSVPLSNMCAVKEENESSAKDKDDDAEAEGKDGTQTTATAPTSITKESGPDNISVVECSKNLTLEQQRPLALTLSWPQK